MKYVAAISAAALLAGVVAANAQGTGTGSSPPAASANQCWDVSTNSVKNQAPSTTASGSGTSSSTVGSTPSGSTGSAAARPAGMRDC
jgi:cytoskeletal protein RodZ